MYKSSFSSQFAFIKFNSLPLKKQIHTMKKIIISSVIALAFLSSCGNNTEKPKGDSAIAPSGKTAAVKYQCEMKCEGEKTYDAAGKCPKCQMEMKEVK
jgi:hypothetical protein